MALSENTISITAGDVSERLPRILGSRNLAVEDVKVKI
jgi:hypothetical protein